MNVASISPNEFQNSYVPANTDSMYYDCDLGGTSTVAQMFQSMLQKLLSIEEYSEQLVALGADIPLSTIQGIRNGSIKDPGDSSLGKLLRFYARTFKVTTLS